MVFAISRLSRVNSFIRTTQGIRKPALLLLIATSPGQDERLADVIIAMTLCPDCRLNSAGLKIKAGRRFVSAESVKGNGTTTTSPASQVTKGLVVLGAVPLVQSASHRAVPLAVEPFCFVHPDGVPFQLVS
jgi:hypothetical protein